MVHLERFEFPTSPFVAERSAQLCYKCVKTLVPRARESNPAIGRHNPAPKPLGQPHKLLEPRTWIEQVTFSLQVRRCYLLSYLGLIR
jgi:hypothetical protein